MCVYLDVYACVCVFTYCTYTYTHKYIREIDFSLLKNQYCETCKNIMFFCKNIDDIVSKLINVYILQKLRNMGRYTR